MLGEEREHGTNYLHLIQKKDIWYKESIQNSDLDCIDKSLNIAIDSTDEDYILGKIRKDYLSKSTVTIHLIGVHGAENAGAYEQRFIKRELQASLYNGQGNTKNGILGVVLPDAIASVYKGTIQCATCGESHNHVNIGDLTTIKEFSYNYYIPNGKCVHAEDERYCVLTTWPEFCKDPESFIEQAWKKREAPIAKKTMVRPT